ncbi:MAG: hypothetical protein RL514_86 [Verrucomicrobiota bacterium]|jgi:transposase-like protein
MRAERHHVLQAQPYERTTTRQGYANGYKPKILASRVGPITFSVPQVRGVRFPLRASLHRLAQEFCAT